MLRPLQAHEITMIESWRNNLIVKNTENSQHDICSIKNPSWFRKVHTDSTSQWLLYLNKTDIPCGVTVFSAMDTTHKTAVMDFFPDPLAKPGTGIHISLEAIDWAFNNLCLNKLCVEVMANNLRSFEMHKEVGFILEGYLRQHFIYGDQTFDVYRLGLLASEWPECRIKLLERIDELIKILDIHPPPDIRSIFILSDECSWMNKYVHKLFIDWSEQGHHVTWEHDVARLESADFCFCLSFSQIIPPASRLLFKHTLVVHESDLPQGKGWSPLTWQILEGAKQIPVTLIEAADRVDSGPIYTQRWIELNGNELIDELRAAQAMATLELCRWFVDAYPESTDRARIQKGKGSFYPRRRPDDSELDPEKSIAEQFNLLRVVDNERYPAFFRWSGQKYYLKISTTSIK